MDSSCFNLQWKYILKASILSVTRNEHSWRKGWISRSRFKFFLVSELSQNELRITVHVFIILYVVTIISTSFNESRNNRSNFFRKDGNLLIF